jgi:hypothetical protein
MDGNNDFGNLMGFFWQVERGRPGRPRFMLLVSFLKYCVLMPRSVLGSDEVDQQSDP